MTAEYDIRARDVPRDLFPNGRCRFSLGPGSKRLQEARRASMDALRREWGAWDVLKAIESGRLSVQEAHASVTREGAAAVARLREKIGRTRGTVPTLREAADQYLEWHATQGHRPKTETLAESEIEAVLRHLPDTLPVDELTTDAAYRAAHTLQNGDRAAVNTARLRVSRLLSVLKHAHHREQEKARIEGRPVAWDLPSLQLKVEDAQPRVRVATKAEAMALLNHAAPYQDAYLRAFLHVGLRASELIYTRYGADLDVETWAWKIQPRKGWKPKGENSHRTLKLPPEPPELRGAITRYLKLSPPDAYVFRNPRTEERWHINTLARDFYRLCDEASVVWGQKRGGLTLHTLRHTCATSLIRAGVGVEYVAGILGDTVQTIMETYVHLTPDDLADAIARGEPYE